MSTLPVPCTLQCVRVNGQINPGDDRHPVDRERPQTRSLQRPVDPSATAAESPSTEKVSRMAHRQLRFPRVADVRPPALDGLPVPASRAPAFSTRCTSDSTSPLPRARSKAAKMLPRGARRRRSTSPVNRLVSGLFGFGARGRLRGPSRAWSKRPRRSSLPASVVNAGQARFVLVEEGVRPSRDERLRVFVVPPAWVFAEARADRRRRRSVLSRVALRTSSPGTAAEVSNGMRTPGGVALEPRS